MRPTVSEKMSGQTHKHTDTQTNPQKKLRIIIYNKIMEFIYVCLSGYEFLPKITFLTFFVTFWLKFSNILPKLQI